VAGSSSTRAFGRYLRTLRERRGLSLDDVATLSRTFADPVEKGYLSRCENGHQSLALSKMIALSRIYEVAAEVLVERLELDLEVEKRGSTPEASATFTDLTRQAASELQRGEFWDAYVSSRTATERASSDPLMGGFQTRTDQERCSVMNYGTAASRLGRNVLALQELSWVETSGGLGAEYQGVLYDRLAVVNRALGRVGEAVRYADLAIQHALKHPEGERYLGAFYASRALLASVQENNELALELHQRAFDSNKQIGRLSGCAINLNNIAQVYIDMGRYRAARRALDAAEQLARPASLNRMLTNTKILAGILESRQGKHALAQRHWAEAIELAKSTDDRIALFKAEFYLLEDLRSAGDSSRAALIEGRLRRRLPWMTEDMPEAAQFRQRYPARKVARRNSVVGTQRVSPRK
jgi:tetratricopeptide (TPR) repeat protein